MRCLRRSRDRKRHRLPRLGLLRPRRTGPGYRLSGRQALEIPEQIAALKFIRIPLRRIKVIPDRNPSGLRGALCVQRNRVGKETPLARPRNRKAFTRPGRRLPRADERNIGTGRFRAGFRNFRADRLILIRRKQTRVIVLKLTYGNVPGETVALLCQSGDP
jgi:DNA-binding transcriptional MerR regulator